jgi:hypothetical protein
MLRQHPLTDVALALANRCYFHRGRAIFDLRSIEICVTDKIRWYHGIYTPGYYGPSVKRWKNAISIYSI